ncbi:hypothetical protein HYPSUDRAFT_209615 [Hypholoma sublateritium FD-334 SS-4]|uniref:Uncharacterized protein n=1 Tax=Hypholoma sublateritium (strain FD-334 SS-4) TaxID=945553 RepID=A0A0D2N9L6_HYPSF|nr:hypothetical protein HYPSUDRAFT_209615 [Hypholoma sublateritium FD-334 SS-4]
MSQYPSRNTGAHGSIRDRPRAPAVPLRGDSVDQVVAVIGITEKGGINHIVEIVRLREKVHIKANRNETKQDETESGKEAIDTVKKEIPQPDGKLIATEEIPRSTTVRRMRLPPLKFCLAVLTLNGIHQLPSARTMASSSFSDHFSEISGMPELLNGAVRPMRRVCAESMGEVSIAHPGSSCDMCMRQGGVGAGSDMELALSS